MFKLNEKEQVLLEDLIKISHVIGNKVAYIQGAGGNVSVKLDNNIMAVKASGYLLKDMSLNNGFSFVDYQKLNQYLDNPRLSEEHFNDDLKQFNITTNSKGLKPSIEVGFHALLKAKYILHTHNVYANVLTCSAEGFDILSKIFKNFVWLPYITVGLDLALQFKDIVSKGKEEPIIFLQNHGLIITGNTAKEAYLKHEEVTKKIIQYLKLQGFSISKELIDIKYMREHVLFPDQIVYTSTDQYLNTEVAKETLQVYSFILSEIKRCLLTPIFLTNNNVNVINNMQAEQYRKNLII